MSITYPVHIPVPIKSSRFGLSINKAQYAGEFTRNRVTQSHGSGTTDRWEGVFTTPVLSPAQHREMSSWLNAMSADDGTFYAYNPDARSLNGSYDDQNLLGTDAEAEHSFTGTYSYYLIRSIFTLGVAAGDSLSCSMDLKTSGGGSDQARIIIAFFDVDEGFISQISVVGTLSITTYETVTASITIPSGAVFVSVQADNNLNSGTSIFSKQAILTKTSTAQTFVPYLKVNGASQTGTSINIKACPISTIGFLRQGDPIQIVDQWYEVTQRADSDASGLATVDILPAIRTSPPDSEPVIVRNQTMLAQLVKTDHPQDTNHNSTGVISFAWQEVV